ncbi:MAG TPA: EpsI family protein [Gammaproteobacteria bacterium]|nr:EpsI family protein [Gammaproteobacteria bacterium]
MQSSETSITDKYISPLLKPSSFLIALIVVLYSYIYADTVKWLWDYWVVEQNWQFLVPVAFVYMLWDRQDLYSGLKREPNILWGTLLLLVASVMLVTGDVSSVQMVREVSMVVSIFAMVFMFFGTKYVVNLFWPLIYLVLMTSLPAELLGTLVYPLKLTSAIVATDALQYFGYAVFRDGTFLYLPYITLEVADSCSGLNQLISAIALGIPIAFIMLDKWWKRWAIILLSIIFGLIMNWVRVFLISIWQYNSAKVAEVHGPYGIYELPFIFLIGVFLTFIIALLIADKRTGKQQSTHQAASGFDFKKMVTMKHTAAYLVTFFILAATVLYLNLWKVEPVYLADGFKDFPLSIAGFKGKPIKSLKKPFYSDLAQDELILQFTSPSGVSAKVYVGYFRYQNQQEEIIDYRYNWLQNGARQIELPSSPVPIQMKMGHVKTRTGIITTFFYYDINGRILIDPVKVKLASLIDALTERRNNGAIIIIQINKKLEQPSAEIQEFLKQIVVSSNAILRAVTLEKPTR